ncbi:cytochrome P450 [Xylariaceae sp. FL0804]|nr:cytochrome P450 [Xylariaceae sp. FL0804]
MAVSRAIISALLLGITVYGAVRYFSTRKTNLPPGPKPWPLVGNLKDLPPAGSENWLHWLKHKDIYGPISSVTTMGTTIVILHSPQMAMDLLDSRSAIYSSRPRLTFGVALCRVGWDRLVSLQPYGKQIQSYRKPISSILGTKKMVKQFYPLQDAETHRCLLRILEDPENLRGHLKKQAGAIILKITFGYTIETSKPDPLVELADEAMRQFGSFLVPGVWLVDTIPALRYLPDWFPGTRFKQIAKQGRLKLTEFTEVPLQFVKKQMARGNYEPSYLSTLLEQAEREGRTESHDLLKFTAGSIYGAGADTREAQKEIDKVIGSERLPGFEDREHLPYLEAVLLEAFRWFTIVPMGLAHLTTADDVYNGYFIPKGSVVLPNIWWFTHDPETYANPDTFDPTRFLGEHPCPDPRDYVFGFGRRTCPGKGLADWSVWLSIARSLAVFDISKGVDDSGNEIEPDRGFSAAVTCHPKPYQATIKPRSAAHEALIREVEKLHPWETSSASELEPLDAFWTPGKP